MYNGLLQYWFLHLDVFIYRAKRAKEKESNIKLPILVLYNWPLPSQEAFAASKMDSTGIEIPGVDMTTICISVQALKFKRSIHTQPAQGLS